jgi:flagellar secretion chaperone FliS
MTPQVFAQQAATAYRNIAVTVPPLQALVMAYDGAITSLQRTIKAVEARQYEEAHRCLVRATAIIRGLDHNLNFDRGGACAERLHRVYNGFIFSALRVFGKPEACESYRKIVRALTEMRDAWVVVARETSATAVLSQRN